MQWLCLTRLRVLPFESGDGTMAVAAYLKHDLHMLEPTADRSSNLLPARPLRQAARLTFSHDLSCGHRKTLGSLQTKH